MLDVLHLLLLLSLTFGATCTPATIVGGVEPPAVPISTSSDTKKKPSTPCVCTQYARRVAVLARVNGAFHEGTTVQKGCTIVKDARIHAWFLTQPTEPFSLKYRISWKAGIVIQAANHRNKLLILFDDGYEAVPIRATHVRPIAPRIKVSFNAMPWSGPRRPATIVLVNTVDIRKLVHGSFPSLQLLQQEPTTGTADNHPPGTFEIDQHLYATQLSCR